MSQKVSFDAIDDESGSYDGKRPRTADHLLEDPTDEELAEMSRSERKRHREKKRRSEVNKGFDDLTKLLQEIDPSISSLGSSRKPSKLDADNALNRVDLINVTVSVLERVHRENERNKRIISDNGLSSRGRGSSAGGGERDSDVRGSFMMVMPYLTPVGDEQPYPPHPPRIPPPVHSDRDMRDYGQYYGGYDHNYHPHPENQRRRSFY